MGTVFIPVDDCSEENGCLQIIVGSHKLGRIEHVPIGGQRTVADSERFEEVRIILNWRPTSLSELTPRKTQ